MATEHRPGVDVVMVNYQTPGDATRFVVSYSETRPAESSLWVANVEPRPEDHVALETALLDTPGEHGLTTWTDNVGYARACNDSAGYGNRQVIAFFNADTVLGDAVLATLHDELMTHDDWGVVGPRQYDDSGLVVSAGIFGSEANPYLRGWKDHDTGQFNAVDDSAVSVSGSAYFLRRAVWDELRDCPVFSGLYPDADGAFLPTPHYYEETWCSYHARAHGYKVVFYGAVAMKHRWHQASPQGGYAERVMPTSQQMFRAACDAHGIAHD